MPTPMPPPPCHRRQQAGTEAKRHVAAQLHDACARVGFFYVRGHGMAPELQGGVLAEARKWFALPVSGCHADHSASQS